MKEIKIKVGQVYFDEETDEGRCVVAEINEDEGCVYLKMDNPEGYILNENGDVNFELDFFTELVSCGEYTLETSKALGEMKGYKTLMIISAAVLVLFMYREVQNERYKRFKLKDDVIVLQNNLNVLEDALNQRDSIITESYKYHQRIRVMLGVDSMDGVITYAELLGVDYKGINKMNKLDLR